MTFAKLVRKLQIFFHEAATCGDVELERERLQDAAMLADAWNVAPEIYDHLKAMAYEGQPKDHPAALRETFKNLPWIQSSTKVSERTGRVKVYKFAGRPASTVNVK